MIQMPELELHGSASDCWMAIGCGVYNMNGFPSVHPGGDFIKGWCGADGTPTFTSNHNWPTLQQLLARGSALVGSWNSTAEPSPYIELSSVASHTSPQDCWACVAGTVYDLTAWMSSHPGGSQVVNEMCGEEATAYFLLAHGTGKLSVLPQRGRCQADRSEEAFRWQNILDVLAFAAYVVVPTLFAPVSRLLSLRMQDRCLRRPLRQPLKSRCLGRLLNNYLSMPLGVAVMLSWFLSVTLAFSGLWAWHYHTFYLKGVKGAGGVLGRMTVYLISMATMLGTRRCSISWLVFRVSYEKTLKAHYVVGMVASLFMILHAAFYLCRFGFATLPGNVAPAAYTLLACIVIFFPAAAITNLRVYWYSLFRITHFLAPAIMAAAIAHLACLSVDRGRICAGLVTSLAWLGLLAACWVMDFVGTLHDAWRKPVTVVSGPSLIRSAAGGDDPSANDTTFISVTLQKPSHIPPGSWMKVACRQAGSLLGHPFTAVVKETGEGKEPATIQFIFKVSAHKSWTRSMFEAIADGSDRPIHVGDPDLESTKSQALPLMNFSVTGPYGGGLGSLASFKVICFAVAGVGVTPAASMVRHLIREGKEVHIFWSCRSAELIQHLAPEYFDDEYFAMHPQHRHIHLSQGASLVPSFVQRGRMNVRKLLEDVATRCQPAILDIGVFVCGPASLESDVLNAADFLNGTPVHVHVHSESFQL